MRNNQAYVSAAGPGWNVKVILRLAGIVAFIVLIVASTILAVVYFWPVAIVTGTIGTGYLIKLGVTGWWWVTFKRIEKRQANALAIRDENSAMIQSVPNVGAFLFAQKEKNAPVIAGSNAFEVGGKLVMFFPATQSERKANGMIIDQLALPAPKPDLRRVLTQEQGAYSIIGAQRSGKSWQAMHIADYWLARGIVPIVYGYKIEKSISNPIEWGGCKALISDDPLKVEAALRKILQLGRMRKDGKSPKTPLPLFLDDWVWMVRNVQFAMDFIGEAGTVLTSTNIIPYFLVQSDTNGAFGTTKYGAMIKKNFTQLYIEPIPNSYGEIVPGHSTGYLVYPNKGKISDRVDVDLISGVPACVGKSPKFIDLAPVVQTVKFTKKQQDAAALLAAGKDKYYVADEVYGHGGGQVKLVEAVMEKVGL